MGNLIILGAVFGRHDVTNHVQSMTHGNKLSVVADRNVFGDSWKGVHKTLVLVYHYEGKAPKVAVVDEGKTLEINGDSSKEVWSPPIHNDLYILGAVYGLSDVTEKVKKKVKDAKSLSLTVNDNSLGSGGLKGKKTLVVAYQYGRSGTHISIVREGDEMNIMSHNYISTLFPIMTIGASLQVSTSDKYNLFYADGSYARYSPDWGVDYGYPKKMNEVWKKIKPGLVSAFAFMDIDEQYILMADGTCRKFFSLDNNIVPQKLKIEDTFPGLGPYKNRIIGFVRYPNPRVHLEEAVQVSDSFYVFLDDGRFLHYLKSGKVKSVRRIVSNWPELDFHVDRIVSVVEWFDGTYIMFLNDGSYIKANAHGIQPGYPRSVAKDFMGTSIPSQWEMVDLLDLKVEKTTDYAGDADEVYIKSGNDQGTSTTSDIRSMKPNSSKDTWNINERYYFKESIHFKIMEKDRRGDNDLIGTVEVKKGDMGFKTKHLTGAKSDYVISYSVNGGLDFPMLIISRDFYDTFFVSAAKNGGSSATEMLRHLQSDLESARNAAINSADHYNEEAGQRLAESMGEIGITTLFLGAQATIVGVTVASSIGASTIAAAAVTGGIAVGAIAVSAAILLPIYFSSLKKYSFLMIANNSDTKLLVKRVDVNNGKQNNGLFERMFLPSKKTEYVPLGFMAFEKYGGLMGLDVTITFSVRNADDKELAKLILRVNTPVSGKGTGKAELTGKGKSGYKAKLGILSDRDTSTFVLDFKNKS